MRSTVYFLHFVSFFVFMCITHCLFCMLASEEIAVVSRVKELFSKINEMRSQRTSLYSQLRDQVLADDITKSIVTRSSDDTQVMASTLFIGF